MIPRLRPMLSGRELAAALRVPSAGDVSAFENAFAVEMGQKHAVAFPYGRTGLVFLFEAMGLKDREIICPAYTCVVVQHAIVISGNVPVFIDSRDDDFNMDLDQVEGLITEKTGAIVPTSIFGYPVDLEKLDAIRSKYPALRVIQDCAHSFAAEWQGRPVHKAGDAALFGLNISKIITSIFGGMITTDDEDLAARLRAVREARLTPAGFAKSVKRLLYLATVYPAFWGPVYGLVNRLERSGLLSRFVDYYDESIIDMPADYLEALTPVEARVGRVQVSRYREIVEHRRTIAHYYDDALRESPAGASLRLPPLVQGATYSHYVPRVEDRSAWLEDALGHGVQLGELIEYSVPVMASYASMVPVGASFPVASRLARTTINLPLSCSETAARRVVDVLGQIVR